MGFNISSILIQLVVYSLACDAGAGARVREYLPYLPYLPKYTDLPVCSQSELNWIARELNERPRKTLDYETPAARFNACVAATD